VQLGYIGFEVRDVAAWARFGTDVLGLVPAEAPAGRVAFRLDGHAQRILIEEGPSDDLAFIGWELDGESELEALAASVGAEAAPDGAAAARRVTRLYRMRDPSGIPVELCCGAERARTPFVSSLVPDGFVADELGLGHVVLGATDPAASQRFYQQLGCRLSDRIVTTVHGFAVDMAFMHAAGRAARHHSVALGGPQKRRIHHFMIEAKAMDEVGRCFDRTLAAGLKIMHTIGRHPNDRMLSFYAKTPSGFHFEFGWGGRVIDDAGWEPTTYDRISEWGHHPPIILGGK
jgi:2,3-dihydroxybiphenyl 1,2-dioxygenase